jgi:hypothetical protein
VSASVYLPTNELNALPFVETAAGRCVPVFSSLEALTRYRPEGGRYVRVPREALTAICPEGVGVLLDGSVALTSNAASELTAPLVGEPQEEPETILTAMRTFAAGRPEVRAARRAQVVPSSGEPAICIGFKTDPGADDRRVLEDAAAAARAAGAEDVLFVPLGEGGELARFLCERTTPFWTRLAAD